MSKRTATSYLILGLLTARDLSAYEIADQLGKGIAAVWSRVTRQYYNAPKRLVEEGLATARDEVISVAKQGVPGARTRTVYSITDAGREALREWHGTEAAPPVFEFEGMIRMMFADGASGEDFRRNLETMAEQAKASRELFEGHAAALLDHPDAIYPERRHLFALANVYCVGHFSHIEEFAAWALDHTRDWDDPLTGVSTDRSAADAALRKAIRRPE